MAKQADFFKTSDADVSKKEIYKCGIDIVANKKGGADGLEFALTLINDLITNQNDEQKLAEMNENCIKKQSQLTPSGLSQEEYESAFYNLKKKYDEAIHQESYLTIFTFIRPVAQCHSLVGSLSSPVFFVLGLSVGSSYGFCTTSLGAKFGFAMPVAAGLEAGMGLGTASIHGEKKLFFLGDEGFHKLSSLIYLHTNTVKVDAKLVGVVENLDSFDEFGQPIPEKDPHHIGVSVGLGKTISRHQGIVGRLTSPFWDTSLVNDIALEKTFPKIEDRFEWFLTNQEWENRYPDLSSEEAGEEAIRHSSMKEFVKKKLHPFPLQ